jgi:menaquinone-specific isochorismate synthase
MTHAPVDIARALFAHSRSFDLEADLLDYLAPRGFAWIEGDAGFVTAGVAAVLAPEDVAALFERFVHEVDDDTPAAAGPRAAGALPFNGVARLIVPAVIVGREPDGRTWCTTVGEVAEPIPATPATGGPSRFDVRAASTRDEWTQAVHRAVRRIRAGQLEKVVLARAVDVHADTPFDRRAVLDHLRRAQPGCRVYADGGFVGASPENLVTRRGEHVACRPLAGTGRDPEALAASPKDAWEHRIVVDAVATQLRALCDGVQVDGPRPIALADVSHLATTITATADDVSALTLARALHPTPAVAATPRRDALRLIGELENFDRGRYAGPCGWVDANGDGEFVVALRCGEIDGAHARIYAGAGIVDGSDPDAEWAETQAKLDPMLRALVRP